MRLLGTILLVVTLVISLSATSATAGENFTFVVASGTWDDQFSWENELNENGVPGVEDTATVPATRTCTVNTEEFATTLTIAGTVIVDGDTLTIGAQGTGTVLDIDSGGTLTIDLGGVVEIENDSVIDGDIVVDDGGALEIGEGSLEPGGSITVLNGGEANFHIADAHFDMEGVLEIQNGGVATITSTLLNDDSDFKVIGSLDIQTGGLLEINLGGVDELDLHNDINVDETLSFLSGSVRISADVDVNGAGLVVGSDGITGAYTLTITENATIKNWGRSNQYGFVNNGTAIVDVGAETETELLGNVVYGSGTWYVYSGVLKSDSATQPVFSTPGNPGTWVIDGGWSGATPTAEWWFAGITDDTFADTIIWTGGRFRMRDHLEDHIFRSCGYFELGGNESTSDRMEIWLLDSQIVILSQDCPE